MEQLASLFQNRLNNQTKQGCKTKWQDEALEATKKLVDSKKYLGSIFKCYKIDQRVAKLALIDTLELNKPYSRYFLKVFNQIKYVQQTDDGRSNSNVS